MKSLSFSLKGAIGLHLVPLLHLSATFMATANTLTAIVKAINNNAVEGK
jgi:hypothetical protein